MRCQINGLYIRFLVHATEDPDIKSFLEPEGWVLHKKPKLEEISSNFEKEVNDVYIAVSNLLRSMKAAIEDGQIDQQELAELKRLRVEIAKQADEVLLLAENLHNQ